MTVSVIIPIYNASQYVEQAIKSAINQNEVTEVIVVDDGSTDNSLELCSILASKDRRIKIHTHENNTNKGPSESRNLGIRYASNELVAFLDADDYYLEGRFTNTIHPFKDDNNLDLIYEPTSFLLDRESKVPFQKNYQTTNIYFSSQAVGIKRFQDYFNSDYGWISLNGVCCRKRIFDKIGNFDSKLLQTQDADFLFRALLYANCLGVDRGEAVAIARSHLGRRTYNEDSSRIFRILLYEKWLSILINSDWDKNFNRKFINTYFYYKNDYLYNKEASFWTRLIKITMLIKLLLRKPKLILKII